MGTLVSMHGFNSLKCIAQVGTLVSMHGFNSLKCSVTPYFFDKSLSLSIIYVLRKIKENLYCGSFIFFNFSALASSNYAIIVAARCSQKSILEDEFN